MTILNGQISTQSQVKYPANKTTSSVTQPKFGIISDDLADSFEDSINNSDVKHQRGLLGKLARFALVAISVVRFINTVKNFINKFTGNKNTATQSENLKYNNKNADSRTTGSVNNADDVEVTDDNQPSEKNTGDLPPVRSIGHVRQAEQSLNEMLDYYANEVGLDIDAPLEVTMGDSLSIIEMPWNEEFVNATLFDDNGEPNQEAWVSRFNKANKTTLGSLNSNVSMRQMVTFLKALKKEEAKNLQLVLNSK